MTKTVKAKVAEHHFKGQVSIGDKNLRKDEVTEVQANNTLRNMVSAGNVVITEGDLSPEKDEKDFQGDDESGEESEEDAVKCEECEKEFSSEKGRKSHARQVH